MKYLSSIELFAGAGGLALGAEKAGFRPIKVVEFNKDCSNTLKLNRKKRNGSINQWPSEVDRDVRDQVYFQLQGKADLVSGGPPCQPFSMGGRHNAQADARDMFPEAVRAVREARPKAFLFENVKGLTRASFSAYFEYIRLQLSHPQVDAKADEDWSAHLQRLQRHHTSHADDSDDYRVVTQVLNAADYGVPQQRHRVFFVGIRADLGREYSFPQPTHSKQALLQSILSGDYAKKTGANTAKLALPRTIKDRLNSNQPTQLEATLETPWRTVREALADLPKATEQATDEWPNHVLRRGAKSYPGHTGSDIDFPAKALKAGVHGVPGGENMLRNANGTVRYFTVRESARLQTFPDDFEFTGSWSEAMRQLGNAVPVKLSEAVASQLYKTLVEA
ncbi:MAG: DNA cytosine methyltransferase [Henriciella sp.]